MVRGVTTIGQGCTKSRRPQSAEGSPSFQSYNFIDTENDVTVCDNFIITKVVNV